VVCVRVEHRATSNAPRTQPPNHLDEEECIFICASVVAGGERMGKRRRRKSLLPSVLTLGYCRRAGVFTVCAEEKEDHGPLKSAEALCTTTLREIRAAV